AAISSSRSLARPVGVNTSADYRAARAADAPPASAARAFIPLVSAPLSANARPSGAHRVASRGSGRSRWVGGLLGHLDGLALADGEHRPLSAVPVRTGVQQQHVGGVLPGRHARADTGPGLVAVVPQLMTSRLCGVLLRCQGGLTVVV